MHAPLRPLAAVALAAIVAACAPVTPPPAQQPVAPQITEETLRAANSSPTGLRQYDNGDYDAAVRSLTASLDHGLLPKMDQSIARKHIAFVHCLSGREVQCRSEFRKAFEIDAAFSLSTAEDGHPIGDRIGRCARSSSPSARPPRASRPPPSPRRNNLLSDGLVKYEAGDFAESQRLLEQSLKEGLQGSRTRCAR